MEVCLVSQSEIRYASHTYRPYFWFPREECNSFIKKVSMMVHQKVQRMPIFSSIQKILTGAALEKGVVPRTSYPYFNDISVWPEKARWSSKNLLHEACDHINKPFWLPSTLESLSAEVAQYFLCWYTTRIRFWRWAPKNELSRVEARRPACI